MICHIVDIVEMPELSKKISSISSILKITFILFNILTSLKVQLLWMDIYQFLEIKNRKTKHIKK